ncbi:glycosyltransferase [Candidatus Woesearchaeota archaeon]|nr:glycosyltransferase [Candidatus Woesearchaeota archaeon]
MAEVQFFSDNALMNAFMVVSFILFSFLFFMFMTFVIAKLKGRKYEAVRKDLPVSVLVPCYNEEKNISSCLESILGSDYDMSKVEIIVIDDGSKDATGEVVRKIIEKCKANIRLLRGEHKGKSEALNLGMKHAKNELVMSIDGDINLERETMSRLVSPMVRKEVAATNAVAVIRKPKKLIEYFQMIEFTLNNLIRISFSRVFDNSIWFFGAVAVYRKSVVNAVGGFKTDTLTEDMDICLEMYSKGYKIVTVKEARISTLAMPSLKALFRQRMRWYFGALQSLFKNRELLKKQRRSPSVLFLFFNQSWWTFFSFVFFPMTAYQIYYWWPGGAIEAVGYIARWFSLSGPAYVLYKMPEWGLNFLNIFGVMAGIVTFVTSIAALIMFKGRFNIKTVICLFFYFPYTIVQDAIIVTGVVKYMFSKKRYFIS